MGPTEVAPGLHAADLRAATNVPTEWAVVSLCRVGGRFDRHPVRRELYLIDSDDPAQNASLHAAVDDAVTTIDAFLDEGHPVVVHCHHGASRTGLVLRAWLMRRHGWDEPTATAHVAERWPALSQWNRVVHRGAARPIPIAPSVRQSGIRTDTSRSRLPPWMPPGSFETPASTPG